MMWFQEPKTSKIQFKSMKDKWKTKIIMFTSSNQVENAPTLYSAPDACFWYFGKLQRVLIQVITPFILPETFSLLFQTA